MSVSTEKLLETLRCPSCQSSLVLMEVQDHFSCSKCDDRFPIVNQIPRILLEPLRNALLGSGSAAGTDQQQVNTARSFGFEWTRFPEMYDEWSASFSKYMQPHSTDFFKGKRVLDAGCGNGRFAHYAAKYGAEVWAVDLGAAVEVARRNTEGAGVAQVIQADLHRLPFAFESFDFIYSIGVLHHLPDPEAAFQNLLRYLKPSGEIQIYLYWKPENQPIKQGLLAAVTGARQVTNRLPHSVVHALAYPAALAAFGFFVWPYQVLKRFSSTKRIAERVPMKQYASLPFRVCVNDQLDRFSAPIENRYSKQEVINWLERASLRNLHIAANFGWVATGTK